MQSLQVCRKRKQYSSRKLAIIVHAACPYLTIINFLDKKMKHILLKSREDIFKKPHISLGSFKTVNEYDLNLPKEVHYNYDYH